MARIADRYDQLDRGFGGPPCNRHIPVVEILFDLCHRSRFQLYVCLRHHGQDEHDDRYGQHTYAGFRYHLWGGQRSPADDFWLHECVNSETHTYNSMFQLTQLNVGSALNIQYNYSATQNNGKITSQSDVISGEQIAYTYDALNRLASAETTATQCHAVGTELYLRWVRKLDGPNSHQGYRPGRARGLQLPDKPADWRYGRRERKHRIREYLRSGEPLSATVWLDRALRIRRGQQADVAWRHRSG